MKTTKEHLRSVVREAVKKVKEDLDRVRRSKDGYGDSMFDEDQDRLRRAKDGYGDSEFDESVKKKVKKP